MGVTLVELVISIVIIGIAATALLQSLGFLSIGNADPMLRSQSNLLAQQVLNEVLGQSFFEPDNDPRTPASNPPAVCPAPESDSGYDRRLWDNVCDYDGFDSSVPDNGQTGIRDKNGVSIAGLDGYITTVSVDDSAGLALGDLSNSGGGCTPRVLRVDVRVDDPRGQSLVLSGYRTAYWDPGC